MIVTMLDDMTEEQKLMVQKYVEDQKLLAYVKEEMSKKKARGKSRVRDKE